MLNRLAAAACVVASAALLAASPAVAATPRASHHAAMPPRARAPHDPAGRRLHHVTGRRVAARAASAYGLFTRGNLYCLSGSRLWIGGPTPEIRSANQTVRYDADIYWSNDGGSSWHYWFTRTQYTNSGSLSTDIFNQSLHSWSWTGGMDSSGTLLYSMPAGYTYAVKQTLYWYANAGDPTGASDWDLADAGYSLGCRAS